MMESAIRFSEVSKSFGRRDGSRQVVLDQVTFSIPAGKSTVSCDIPTRSRIQAKYRIFICDLIHVLSLL